ncbi:DMT family transporter [Streptomonospora algeriensis]|uniref:DMT family transporter n=1 Tax=Streptomonospora algeriensis TaxID=995084 RepID=A0ABW3BAP6_9ACTN
MSAYTGLDARGERAAGRAFPRARTTAWVVLVLAGLLEIVWSLALTEADGLSRPGWAVGGIVLAMISLGMLSYSLGHLPVGTAYAVWVGIGAVGVAVVGMLFLGEPAGWERLIFLGLIIAGVIGLNQSEKPDGSDGAADTRPAAHD